MNQGAAHRPLCRILRQKALKLFPQAITHVETDAPTAALTFDDGPHPVYTPLLLSILEKQGAQATFFMVGVPARRHPEIVRMVAEAGHAIGNHSWDHPNLNRIRPRRRRLKQMRACAKATAPYGQRLFRPPFGQHSDDVRFDALLFRCKLILWSVSAQDWLPQKSEVTAQKIIERTTPGAIFLLHDAIYSETAETQADRKPMLAGLETALAALRGKIRFVTVPELLRSGRPVSNWPRPDSP